MNTGQCLLCLKSGSEYIADKVTIKELTHKQAASELGVDIATWISHYELHIRDKLITAIATDIEPIKSNLIDKIKEGTESVTRIINLTKSISKRLESEDAQKNMKLIQTYAQLENNLMNSLKGLAILEGDIGQATTVNIQNNIIKVDTIMSIVMEEASEEFKNKILERLKTLDPMIAN